MSRGSLLEEGRTAGFAAKILKRASRACIINNSSFVMLSMRVLASGIGKNKTNITSNSLGEPLPPQFIDNGRDGGICGEGMRFQ